MAFCPPLPPESNLITVEIEHWERELPNDITHFGCTERWVDAAGVAHAEEGSPFLYSTACWREYVGTWKIEDERFYLVSITGRLRLAQTEPLLADWFTGTLRIPRGRELLYVHMGFGSVTETELHIRIGKGCEMERRIYDNRGKSHDWKTLGWANLPGSENRFPGDQDFD